MDQGTKYISGDLFVSGNLQVGSDTPDTGDVTITGTLDVGGDVTLTDILVDTLEAALRVLISETPGAHEAAPDLAFGDGDTGLWEAADDQLWVGTGGSGKMVWSAGGTTSVGDHTVTGQLWNTRTPGAQAAAPTIALGDLDTGFYESADDVLKVTTAGVERATVDSSGITIASTGALVASASQAIKASATPGALGAAPTIALGDLDTGLWESADDVLELGTAGVSRLQLTAGQVNANGSIQGTVYIRTNIVPGAYDATPIIALGDFDTGFWESADDVLHVGTAGTSRMNVGATGIFTVTLPTYADDAAAGVGGLTANQLYKTASGEVRIKT